MPASAREGLDQMEKALKTDSETAKHDAEVAKMAKTKREIELLNMATVLADSTAAGIRRQADYNNKCGLVCSVCRQHPHECYC
jgi:hypothetical protein